MRRTISNVPPLARGVDALFGAVRMVAEAAQAHVIGLRDEFTRQLEAAHALLTEADRIATVHGDDELLAAVARAGAVVRALAGVPS